MSRPTEETVLIVEDDPGVADLQRRRLERAGLRVVLASSGTQALAVLETRRVDLMLLDYRLPEGNGLQFYSRLKAAGRDLPVILVTGFSDEKTIIIALRAGVRDFISKTAEYLAYLPEAVERVLKQSRLERQLVESEARFRQLYDEAPVGYHELDTAGRIVSVNRTELAMLGYRAEEMLGRYVWEFAVDPEASRQTVALKLAGQTPASAFERTLRRKDGVPLSMLVEDRVLKDPAGQVLSIATTLQDISVRKRAEAALQAAKDEWEQTFSALTDDIAILNRDGAILQANQAMCERFAGRPGGLIGQDYHEVYFGDKDDREAPARETPFTMLLSSGAPARIEIPLPTLSGVYSLACYPLLDAEQRPWRVVSVVRDITLRKQAEELRRQSEEKYRMFVETTGDWVWSTDCQNITYCNPAVTTLLGYRPEELLGHNSGLIHADDRQAVLDLVERCRAEKRGWSNMVFRFQHKLGHFRRFEGSAVPILDAAGEVAGFRGVSRDITDRMQADERIREQAALLDQASDAIVVRDMQDQIHFWNLAAERLYGWTAAEAVGPSAARLPIDPPSPELEEARRAVLENGQWSGELRQVTRQGKAVIVASRWALVRDERGTPKSKLIINTDITEKKQFEAHLLRHERMQSIGTLASGIAHDLNNMLTPIMMAVGLLELQFTDPDSQSLLEILKTSTQRGADLVRQILSFSKGGEGRHEPLALGPMLGEVEKLLKQTFPKSITHHVSTPPDLWLVSADGSQLHQVLMNLCVNARDAMPRGGRLTVSAKNLLLDEPYVRMRPDAKAGPYVMLSVEDTGTGIPPEILDRIFDPFFSTKESGKGTGLGLSTTLGIVKSHGGFANVYSEVGKGTRIAVYLPALQSGASNQTLLAAGESTRGHGELILVVDDEAPIRDIARVTLEAAGYRVVTAQDGAEAVAVYAQHLSEIQAVVTDMMMPVMDGQAAIQALKRLNPHVRVLATSGLIRSDRTLDAIDLKVLILLPKPFTAHDLLDALGRLLSSGPETGESPARALTR